MLVHKRLKGATIPVRLAFEGDEMNQEVLTVSEVAQIMRVSRALAYEGVRTGLIPSIRIGRRILIPSSGLRALLDGRTFVEPEPTISGAFEP